VTAERDRLQNQLVVEDGRRLLESTRMELFSDGVFAIAATLLVVEVAVPVAPEGHLGRALLDAWPAYTGYAVSFAVIGVHWVNHHASMDRIANADRTLLFLNLLILGCIAFIPFPTALVADYITEGGANAKWATFTYAIVLIAAALSFALFWGYLSRHRELLTADCEPHAPRVAVKRSIAGAGAYAVTAVLALISPVVAVVFFFLIAGAFIFAERTSQRS
jgi:uncharacterized membrane protein